VTAPRPVVSLRETVRHRAFRWILAGLLLANTGYWMQTVAAAFLIRQWTGGDPVMVSLVQSSLFLPAVVMMMPAGVLVDMFDRRRVMIFAQGWMMVVAAAITALVMSGATNPWFLLALLALVAVGFALSTPAQSSIWPELVGLKEVGNAISLYSMTNNGARLIGPAVAGALIAGIGVANAVAVNALAYVAVIAALLSWRRTVSPALRPTMTLRGALLGGLTFAAANPPFRNLLVRGGIFFVIASIVLGVFPVKVLNPEDFGTVFSFFGLGAVLGALNYPAAAARFPRARLVSLAIAGHACGLIGAAATDSVALLGALTCLIGFSWFFVMSSVQVGAQISLPDDLRGRGLALLNLILMSGYAFGSPLWGAVARFTTPDQAILIAAGVSLAALAATFRLDLPDLARSS
jgi:MFS family permease